MSDNPHLLRRGALLPDGSVVVQLYVDSSSQGVALPAVVIGSEYVSGKGYLIFVNLPSVDVDRVTLLTRRFVRTGGATLDQSYVGTGPALEITDAEWDRLPEPVRDLYRPNTELVDDRTDVLVDGVEWVEVDSHAIDTAPRNWRPDVVGRTMGPLFYTQFGGWLTGWRQRACEIAREYSNDVYEHLSDSSIKVHVRSFWDPPKTTTEGKGRQRRTRETWHTTQLTIDTPHLIAGHNLADAQQRWTKKEQELRDELSQYTGSRICGHCNGDGWITSPNATKET
jgi:hypothetical protein